MSLQEGSEWLWALTPSSLPHQSPLTPPPSSASRVAAGYHPWGIRTPPCMLGTLLPSLGCI